MAVRDWAKKLLREEYGVCGREITLLKEQPNATFRVGGREAEMLLRLHPQGGRQYDELLAEMAWLEHLSRSMLVQTPRPGKTGMVIRLPEVCSRWAYATALGWIEGEILPSAQRCADHYRQLGRLLGKLHTLAEEWPDAGRLARSRLDSQAFVRSLEGAALSEAEGKEIACLLGRVAEVEKQLEQQPGQRGLIHGDPSFGNVIFHGSRLALIDFDDCGHGFFAYDLAVVLAGAWGREDYAVCREQLLHGYAEARPLAEAAAASLPLFMAQRAVSLVLWATGRPARDRDRGWIPVQLARMRAYVAG